MTGIAYLANSKPKLFNKSKIFIFGAFMALGLILGISMSLFNLLSSELSHIPEVVEHSKTIRRGIGFPVIGAFTVGIWTLIISLLFNLDK